MTTRGVKVLKLARERPDRTRACKDPIKLRCPSSPLLTYHFREHTWYCDISPFIEVRCRKCPGCIESRKALWVFRAIDCWRWLGGRAHFVTLTYPNNSAPGAKHYWGEEGRLRTLREGARDLKTFLNSLRYLDKGHTGEPARGFKYLAAAEWTKAGQLHWHLLILEAWGRVLDASEIEDRWKWRAESQTMQPQFIGDANTFIAKKAGYVAKYIAKGDCPEGTTGRIFRASIGFGGSEWRTSQQRRNGVRCLDWDRDLKAMTLARVPLTEERAQDALTSPVFMPLWFRQSLSPLHPVNLNSPVPLPPKPWARGHMHPLSIADHPTPEDMVKVNEFLEVLNGTLVSDVLAGVAS